MWNHKNTKYFLIQSRDPHSGLKIRIPRMVVGLGGSRRSPVSFPQTEPNPSARRPWGRWVPLQPLPPRWPLLRSVQGHEFSPSLLPPEAPTLSPASWTSTEKAEFLDLCAVFPHVQIETLIINRNVLLKAVCYITQEKLSPEGTTVSEGQRQPQWK